MVDKDKTIEGLMYELYIKLYMEDNHIECEPDSSTFKMYLLRDWRFQAVYNKYKRDNDDKITAVEFARKYVKTDSFWNLFNSMLNLPDNKKPDKVYIDEKYPFIFEIMNAFSAPDFDEFKMEFNAEFNATINKLFFDLTDAEIKNRKIAFLKNKISERNTTIRRRRESYKQPKRIYKYDSNGLLNKIYNSRKECCDSENITKAALSMHLSGKRKKLNGYTYIEE